MSEETETATKKYSVKYKRNRSSRACEVCHSRKVRCDATIHIPCTNCLTFGCECRFPEPKERKNARNKKSTESSSNSSSNDGDSRLQNPVKKESPAPNVTSVPAVTIPGTGSNATKRRNEPLAAISARSASIDNQKLTKHHFSTLSFHGRASTAVLLAVDKDKDTHLHMQDYVPPALKNSIDQTRVGLDTVQMEILRLRGAFLLPEKALCDDLINTFFEHIYPVEPVVDRKMFMKQYESGTGSLLLLQSILLAASRVSDNELIFDSNGSNYLTSATFFQRAKALYEANYEKEAIPIIQSLSLFSRFWEGIDDILGNSFYWTRIAITAAQGFGFHRNMSGNFSNEEIKVCKILWWNLYIRDISCSVAFGRPRVIHLEDCDVPMLQPSDFPPELPRHDAEAFVQMIRLSEIMSIVLQEQYSIRAEKSKRQRENLVMTHCDMIMSGWRSNLPPQLQYAPHQQLPLSVNILNLYYYSAVCLVHRSNMVRTVDGKEYPSEGIVFKASRIIADIGSRLLKSGDIKYCYALTIPVFFTAALTFICHMDSSNPSISKSAKLGYNICKQTLKEIGKNYLVAVLILHGMERFADDDKLREKLVGGMMRKSNGQQTNGATTPIFNAVLQSATSSAGQTPAPFTPAFGTPGTGFMDFNTSQGGTPAMTPNPPMQRIPEEQQQPQQQPSQSQPPTRTSQQPEQNMEFPDLYLFTNTLPSNGPSNFDPSELFPAPNAHHEASTSKSDTTSDGLPTDFNINLPEFDFQNFSNTISLQNLASLNAYGGNTPGQASAEEQAHSLFGNFGAQ
ncbi:CYFA0S02e06480g1_1 [Cyberlindnera fabianii]|uniref:CYFA0S02e06480g1_1 n=1 Tax=Cyberlindnera fabianii TaxID=36022 RepID=A0A061AMP3_CYBFA|nr:Cutinase transcription factor 1 alpha [Cyberlindnera fabianii]CDR38827.1 CYFA0S02e06480g1_1 [Cyberlindnera fabianii]